MADEKDLDEPGAPGGGYDDRISDAQGLHRLLVPATDRRERIRNQVEASMRKIADIDGTHYKLEVQDVRIDKKDYSLAEQKDAILQRRSLTEPVKAVLVLRDKRTGEVVDKSTRTMAQIPWMTPRHTFTVDGNEYVVANQLRVKPGVYTRQRANGELESHFNLGRGANFRLSMDPEKGKFNMEYQSTKIPLYPVLKGLGVSDDEIDKAWGKELADVNRKTTVGSDAALRKAYTKMARHTKADVANMKLPELRAAVMEEYGKTVLNPDVTKITLGDSYNQVTPTALVSAAGKISRVHRGDEEEDDRDSLAFKTLHTVDTFFKERLEKDAARKVNFKIKSKLNRTLNPKISDILPTAPYSEAMRSLVTVSALSQSPTQINPVEVIDAAVKVTSLGEGGISSLRSVPDTARAQHGSQFGVLDPVRTPESGAVGVDIRAAVYTAVDQRGNMLTPLINAKTKAVEYVPVSTFTSKNVGMPRTDLSRKMLPVIRGNKMYDVPSSEVDYILPHDASLFSPTSNLVPGINGMQGNRAIMGSKQVTQSLPLIHREVPYVQVKAGEDDTMEGIFAKWHLPVATGDGTVRKIDNEKGRIVITPDGGGKDYELDFAKDFPFASKTRLHHELKVKEGDKVKNGQHLAESNFTKDGKLAQGVNLRTAFMAYKGLNSNDAVVISESCAKKLTSEHLYTESLPLGPDIKTSKNLHRTHFGTKHTMAEYERLDEAGVIRVGQEVHSGELLIAALKKKAPSAEDAMLGRINKSLNKAYRDCSVVWDHGHKGVVKDVAITPKSILVSVYTEEPMGIGDKVSGRHGNKGVVSTILPDDQMPHGEDDTPIDILMTSAGVVSRINPSQIIEGAMGKVARKTGNNIAMEQFPKYDKVQWAKEALKANDIKDKETLTDPLTGKKIPGIFVGDSYYLKLFKSTDTNFSARGIGSTDVNLQPTKGGTEGAKSFGRMDVLALVAHDARNILKEGSTTKSDRNDEYWRRVKLGLPESQPQTSFAFNKFKSMLIGGGMNVTKRGDQFHLAPLTDRDIDAMAPQAITNANVLKVKSKKDTINMVPERGGLFDPAATGGLNGTRWSKIELNEPIVNPLFEGPAAELLGKTNKQFREDMFKHGGDKIKRDLNRIDLDGRRSELNDQISLKLKKGDDTDAANAELDKLVKQVKYIDALKRADLKAGDAYVLTKIPVIPPTMRALVSAGDKVLVSDPNFLYKDLMMVNQAAKDVPEELRALEDPVENRKQLSAAVSAVFGLGEPVNPKTAARSVRGFMTQITGQTSPKQGYYHANLISKKQQLSGRGTIAPDPSLQLDQVGIPEEALWKQYEIFIVRRLVRKGYNALDAQKMVEERRPGARQEMLAEIKERPVLINRAPTLHRYNMVAAYAVPVPGKTIRLNPFAEIGLNADYDGDAVQVHLPASAGAVADARAMTLSNLIYSDGSKNDIMVKPQHEAIVGAYMATMKPESGPPKTFKTRADAMAAYNRNEITMSTPVVITEKTRKL